MDVHTSWDQKAEKTETWDDIGQILVPGALNDTKTIRKAGGDMFENIGLEQSRKNLEKSMCSPLFSNFFQRI